MENERLLSILSYSSIFYCPLIVPLVVYFAQSNEYAKFHAKRAAVGQTLVIGSGLLSFLAFFMIVFFASEMTETFASVLMVSAFGIFSIVALAVSIWSIIMTIRVVR